MMGSTILPQILAMLATNSVSKGAKGDAGGFAKSLLGAIPQAILGGGEDFISGAIGGALSGGDNDDADKDREAQLTIARERNGVQRAGQVDQALLGLLNTIRQGSNLRRF